MGYMHYYNAGAAYGLSERQVQSLVKKHGIEKRRVYGRMAVNTDEFDQLMRQENIVMLPNYKRISKSV